MGIGARVLVSNWEGCVLLVLWGFGRWGVERIGSAPPQVEGWMRWFGFVGQVWVMYEVQVMMCEMYRWLDEV
jgi:hypothetical protein